jgi:hypothetical protein
VGKGVRLESLTYVFGSDGSGANGVMEGKAGAVSFPAGGEVTLGWGGRNVPAGRDDGAGMVSGGEFG